jgi:dTMP kinase
MTGRYIVLEGIDGAGTSTLLNSLAGTLEAAGLTVRCAAQPSNAGAGAMARQFLKQPLHEEFERAALALFFAADRLELRREFEAAMAQGEWVLCDRSVLSSLVYQGSELDEEWVAAINRFALPADLTFLLDLPSETSWERISARGGDRERFEVLDTLTVLRQRYLDAARGFASPVRLIDATQDPDGVLSSVLRALRERGWIE